MKKLLSIVLSVALLLSMFTAIPVVAVEGEETAVSTALGDYYKFTFGKDGDQYDYTVANKTVGDTTGQATFKENTFYPLLMENADASKGSADYKTITIAGGETVDVLEVKLSNNGYFVPLTKDGTPFEMVPGVKYNVNVKFFNPVCNTWGQLRVAAGGLNDKVADYSKKVNGVTWSNGEATAKNNVSVGSPFVQSGGNGIVSGNSYAAFLKEGSYGTPNVAVSCICAQYSTEEKPIECTHSSRYVTPYREVSDIIGVPEANGVKNENGTYSTKYSYVDATPDDASDDVYVEGNNYLAFTLSGGKVSTYKTYPIYSNATAEEIAAAGEETTWQIVSIEIASENLKSKLSYSVNGEIIKTVEGDAETPLEAVVPTAPEGKYFVGWYNDEAYTDVFTSTALEYGVKTVYARFADYGTYAKNDYEDGKMPATAVMNYAGGTYYPLLGYSYKGNSYDSSQNKGELKAHLERAGLSTEFPASAIAFYSDRTWGMPGCATFYNADGTLFVPKAGDTYKVTYKYMAPVHNGKEMAINIGYGISIAHANQTSTKDQGVTKSILKYNTITEPVTEWTTVSEFITVPEASDNYVPAIALQINGAAKKAVYEEDGETVKYYDYTAVLLDYIEIERVPVGKVTFMNADGTENSVASVPVGEEITYPVLKASLNTDNVWSASATEYVAPPKTVEKEEEITVYAYESPVISYENSPLYVGNAVELYPGAINYDNEMNAVVSDKEAYSGKKSMRLRNYGFQWVVTEDHYNTAVTKGAYKYDAETDSFVKLDEVPEFVPATAETIADGTAIALKRVSVETGMNVIRDFGEVESLTFDYKITFKYKATANNTTESTLSARLFPKGNIWWGSPATLVGSFTFPAGATDGWVTGEMYVRAENAFGGSIAKAAQVLDLKFNGNAEAFTNEIYIDDITIEDIEGLGTVTYVNGETTFENLYISGDEISYPALPSDRQGDMVWSFSADEYVAAPKTFSEDITVYAILSDVIGFESYCGDKVDYIKNCLNVSVSEDVAFSGNKSLKYENNGYTYVSKEPATWATDWTKYYEFNEDGEIVALGGEEAPVWKDRTYLEKRGNSNESAIALWSAPGGKAYKVSFKYFVPVELGVNVTLTPYTNGTNLWGPEYKVSYKDSAYVIGTDTVAGEWLDGEFYFVSGATVEGYDLLYIHVAAAENFTGELVYFDDFTLTEVQYASFIIPEDATFEDGGILKDGVVTVYAEMDEEIVAPLVIDAEGNPVENWADENGKKVTEFVNGGTYTVAPAFIYGDCDDNGEIDTGDLAAIKLYLAGLGEVGLGADCDASGEVDTGDLAALKLYLAGMGNLGPAE